jgi:hypothetical protein
MALAVAHQKAKGMEIIGTVPARSETMQIVQLIKRIQRFARLPAIAKLPLERRGKCSIEG